MKPAPKSNAVLYPTQYIWFVLVSALDVMFTWIVLWVGGREVNRWANHVIEQWGLPGLVVFKFALVIFVILLCEAVGRRSPVAGRRLAAAAILITCLPVLIAVLLLRMHL